MNESTLLNFLTTYVSLQHFFLPPPLIFLLRFSVLQVIHAEVSKFHNEFQKADSLDDMIHLHNVQ